MRALQQLPIHSRTVLVGKFRIGLQINGKHWLLAITKPYYHCLFRRNSGNCIRRDPMEHRPWGLIKRSPLTAEIVNGLVEESLRHVKYLEYFFSPGTPMPAGFKPKQFSNFIVDASADYEVLFKVYSSQNKRNLKKADAASFELAEWATVQDAVQLWQNNVREKTAIPAESFDRLGKLLEFCHYQKRGVLYAVRDEYNQLCGAVLGHSRG